jgi:hypothetical protein
LAILGLALLVPCVARAQGERRVALAYTRAPQAERCPDATELGDRVAAELGYDPFDAAAAERLTVEISRQRGEYVARIALVDGAGEAQGERELGARGDDCSELAAALALAIAIAIDPVRVNAPEPEPEPEPEPRPDPKREPPAPRVENLRAAQRPSQPAEIVLAAGVLVAAGTAPAIAPGVWIFGGMRWSMLSIGLEGRADFPASKSVDGGTVSASSLLATLLPCVHFDPLFACALGSLGALQGSGEGVSSPRKATTLYARAGARLGVDLALGGSVGLWVFGDLAGNLTRTTLELDGRPAWESPALGGDLGAGVRGRF